ncbi:hypothetical protein QT979_08875 [Microcoleus sp. w2-18bC1]|uniref:hypothetical protein n=1 Tax=unclassified Microcoleus TaxID=2642155 RepID=UPI002FD62937
MFRKDQTKNSSKSVLDVQKLNPLVMDLNEQSQESISGGEIQRLQEEFAAELATVYAIALPSFLNQANKAKQ